MQHLNLTPVDLIGFAASAMVFATFCMRTLLPLRLVALCSNLCFIAYGLAAGLVPILALHLLLLPMNLLRTGQHLLARRRLRAALTAQPDLALLLPHMTPEDHADGEILFRKGDIADRFYAITSGTVQVEGIAKTLSVGDVFGEVGLLAQDGRRTATARAAGPVRLAAIDREALMRVCLDQPEFGLFLTRLLVTRMLETETALAARHRDGAGPGRAGDLPGLVQSAMSRGPGRRAGGAATAATAGAGAGLAGGRCPVGAPDPLCLPTCR